jgi:hypothetical protein
MTSNNDSALYQSRRSIVVPTTAMTAHRLTLGPEGKEALDALLKRTVEGDAPPFPAIHFGATTATGELYFNCAGDRVYGEPEKGAVNEDTSENRPKRCC